MAKRKRLYTSDKDIELARKILEHVAEDEEAIMEILEDIQGESISAGGPSPKEVNFALNAYFNGSVDFQNGFDEAIVMMSGWSLPTFFERFRKRRPKRWFPKI